MQRSLNRILTTHVGSLPRPADLVETMIAREKGEPTDPVALSERVKGAVHELVDRQLSVGLDVINDGEANRYSYTTYVTERLSGFDGVDDASMMSFLRFPEFPNFKPRIGRAEGLVRRASCDGPIRVKDPRAVHRDIETMRAALEGPQPSEVFITAASPGAIARSIGNTYYPSREAYVFALAEAMRDEYRAIVEAGFVLQLDCPDLAAGRRYSDLASLSDEEWRRNACMHVEALNGATAGLPGEQLRTHICWSNHEGPHNNDVPLAEIADIVLSVRAGGLSVEAANPRHAHEWKVWRDVRLPDGMVLIPGVIESCNNYVEHPELVAERLVRYAEVVGRENVIAGADCGYGTAVGQAAVDPDIAWAKFGSLVEGARLASQELWPG